MQTTTTTSTPPGTASPGPNGHALASHPLPGKLRRRPLMALLWAALVLFGAVLGVLVWMGSRNAAEVVAVRATVDRGALIIAEDLMVVRVAVDPAVRTVPAAQLNGMVGQRAAGDLAAGTLLSPAQVQPDVIPRTGESVVGIALGVGQLPAEPLRPGDRVRLVQTPADQAEVPAVQVTVDAVVQSVANSADGQRVVVDVVVPSGKAAEVAARAATGRVALVLDSRER